MIHRYYAPVQLLALSPILYLTVQKGTTTNAGLLKVRGPIWSNRPKTGPDNKGYTLQHTTILLTLRTLNLHSNDYARIFQDRKFTPIYTLNLCSRTFYDILKKKQEEKSYDMQKFTLGMAIAEP